ncbi:MAG: c-type cytochrome domain-containing protein, partial [Planctomycetota bacterium]
MLPNAILCLFGSSKTACSLASILLLLCHSAHAADELSFSRDVRPILSEMCFSCHGPDEKGRKGELLLSEMAGALQGGQSGQPAIVPGKPALSEMIKRLHSQDPDERMPPGETKKNLSPAQITILEKWIESGAKYEKHWAFVPPTLPPAITDQPNSKIPHPIDALVRATLARNDLSPT